MKKLLLFAALLLVSMSSNAQLVASYGTMNLIRGNGYEYRTTPDIMGHHRFERALSTIASRSFDSSRLQVAKQVASQNPLLSAQVRQIMDLLTFESSKLKFAKFAFSSVVDRQNFFMVNDAFTFNSSIRELERFTANRVDMGSCGKCSQVGCDGGCSTVLPPTNCSKHRGCQGGSCQLSGGVRGSGTVIHHGALGRSNGSQGRMNRQGRGSGQMNGTGQGQQFGQMNGGGQGQGIGQMNGQNQETFGQMSGGGFSQGHDGQMNGGSHYVLPGPEAMCRNDFRALIRQIQRRCFESSKLLVAKQSLDQGFVTADQVREIMMLFTFESTKLEFAKLAFHHTVDQQNYFLLNDAFTFDSSVRELNRFVVHN